MAKKDTPKASDGDDAPIVPPPSTVTVEHSGKPVLYLPNGKVLYRRVGF